jgi:CheY-like chemotaxis protein
MNLSVLLVDDSAVQAATRRMILERAGYHVVVSLDAHEALTLLSDHGCGERYSLVITDHIMPALSGAEFVTLLREICQTLPVVVLSGMAEAEAQYEELNVEFHLKPFAPEELLATVARLIDEPPMFRTA